MNENIQICKKLTVNTKGRCHHPMTADTYIDTACICSDKSCVNQGEVSQNLFSIFLIFSCKY